MSLSYPFKNKFLSQQFISQKGFTLPIVAIFVLAFLIAPIAFWFTSSRELAATNVQGVESSAETGIYLKVVSTAGSWDLSQYLCKTKADCIGSLTAGKKAESLSGGVTQGSSKRLNYTDALNGYEYIKVFVRSGWGTDTLKSFNIAVQPDISGVETQKVQDIQVILIPVEAVKSGSFAQILFTDQL